MAEGLLRQLAGEQIQVFSAGSAPSRVNPLAIQVMAERGIDIGQQRSKHWQEFLDQPFDDVITVCDEAAKACPVFPGPARRIYWSLPDPASASGNDEERLQIFRQVRDALESRLRGWLAQLAAEQRTQL